MNVTMYLLTLKYNKVFIKNFDMNTMWYYYVDVDLNIRSITLAVHIRDLPSNLPEN